MGSGSQHPFPFLPLPTWRPQAAGPRLAGLRQAGSATPSMAEASGLPHLRWRRGGGASRSAGCRAVRGRRGRAALGGDAAAAAGRRDRRADPHRGRPKDRSYPTRCHSQHGGGAAPALPAAPARGGGESSRELGAVEGGRHGAGRRRRRWGCGAAPG